MELYPLYQTMKGYVYRLNGGDKFYIGSTSLTPEKRLGEHKSFSQKGVRRNIPVYVYFSTIGWENVTVETLKEFEYTSKKELLQYEREEYNKVAGNDACLNVNRPCITHEELKKQVKENASKWHQEHKEHCREKLNTWRKENPEKVKEQRERGKDKMKELQRKYREEHKEEQLEKQREWRKNNPEKYEEQKRRAIEKINEKRRIARGQKNNVKEDIN